MLPTAHAFGLLAVWGTLGRDSRDVIREVEADGWRFIGANGSHHHFKHPFKPGKVTIPHPRRDLHPKTLKVDLSSGRPKGKAVTAMASYIALVHKDDGTSYGVSFPDVPGCISAGDTFEEAVANSAGALAAHFALMEADGETVPSPRSYEQLKRDPEFLEDSADAIVTMVTPRTTMAAAE